MKYCPKCKIDKDSSEFSKCNSNHDGLQSYCKPCKNIYTNTRSKENRKHVTAIQNRSNKKHSDKRKRVAKLWRKNNPEKVRAQDECYRDPPKHAARVAKRRALKGLRTPKWLTEDHFEQIEAFYILREILQSISGNKMNVDHIIPLQGENISGLHVPWNLQVLTHLENAIKKNKFDGTYDNNDWRKI